MKDIINGLIERFRRQHVQARRYVAMMLVLAFVPFYWGWWLAAFAVFRFFDAVKPWPIKWFDARVHGGLGIMLDDVIAALFTLLVLQVAAWWW